MHRHAPVLMLACLALAPVAGKAESLRIEPVSLTLRSGQDGTWLWLSNSSNRPLRARASLFAWSQADGSEHLQRTGDLVVSPAVIDIPPAGRQRVRVARRTANGPVQAEAAYRLLLEGGAGPGADPTGALRYSIPVFSQPDGATRARLSARIEIEAGGRARLRLDNAGERHARITDLVLVDRSGGLHTIADNLAGYVLAGRHKYWPLPPGMSATALGARVQAGVDGRATLLPGG